MLDGSSSAMLVAVLLGLLLASSAVRHSDPDMLQDVDILDFGKLVLSEADASLLEARSEQCSGFPVSGRGSRGPEHTCGE